MKEYWQCIKFPCGKTFRRIFYYFQLSRHGNSSKATPTIWSCNANVKSSLFLSLGIYCFFCGINVEIFA